MKKLFVAILALALGACSNPEKTIENLKAAATGESNASAQYAAYSKKAVEEGFVNVSNMLAATSFAESRHAAKHLEELVKLGVKDFQPIINPVEINTTVDNLKKAIEGEVYEFTTMYPEFMKVAVDEGAKGANISFDWANRAEIKHADFYTAAVEALSDSLKGDSMVVATWIVCPKCGDTYTIDAVPADACELCATPAEQYIMFPKKD